MRTHTDRQNPSVGMLHTLIFAMLRSPALLFVVQLLIPCHRRINLHVEKNSMYLQLRFRGGLENS